MDIQIRKNAIMRWRNGKIVGMKIMKIGIINIREMTAMVEPMRVGLSAWCPCPLIRSSWPGRIPKPVSSSGAPRKIEGMKSTKVWVIAIAVMKIRRIVIGRLVMKVSEIRKMATRLMWIPGTRPVRVPARMPRISAIRSWSMVCCGVTDINFFG